MSPKLPVPIAIGMSPRSKSETTFIDPIGMSPSAISPVSARPVPSSEPIMPPGRFIARSASAAAARCARIGRITKRPRISATIARIAILISCIVSRGAEAKRLLVASVPVSASGSKAIERMVMTSPRFSSKPTAEATSSFSAASSSSVRGVIAVTPLASLPSTPSTRTATVRRLISPGLRSTSRVVSETSKFTCSRVSEAWLCDFPPFAASPCGRFEATVTGAGLVSSDFSERSCVSVEIATRLSGSIRFSVIASRSVTVCTDTSTTALP